MNDIFFLRNTQWSSCEKSSSESSWCERVRTVVVSLFVRERSIKDKRPAVCHIMSEWVAVVSEEGEEPIEIPTESDGTMLLSTLSAQFPKVTGLKFRNPENNLLRGVRCHDNTLFPPFPPAAATEEPGCSTGTWGGHTYICNLPPSALKITKKVSQTLLPTVHR